MRKTAHFGMRAVRAKSEVRRNKQLIVATGLERRRRRLEIDFGQSMFEVRGDIRFGICNVEQLFVNSTSRD